MNKLDNALDKIAEKILHIDEASLTSLWEPYKRKAEQFSQTPEWEKAVIIFSIINAVKAKNAIYNENILKKNDPKQIKATLKTPKDKHYLKLVK